MAAEPAENIRPVCFLHAPRPQEKYAKLEPTSFVGKFVKIAFQAHGNRQEHMWVEVKKCVKRKGEAKLIGELNNDPALPLIDPIVCGDEVVLVPGQIELVVGHDGREE